MNIFYLLLLLPMIGFSQNRNDTISIKSNKRVQAIIFLQKKNCSVCFTKVETKVLQKYDMAKVDFYFAWIGDADTFYAKRNQQLLNNNFATLKIEQHLFIERHTYLINGLIQIVAQQEYNGSTPYGVVIENNRFDYYFP